MQYLGFEIRLCSLNFRHRYPDYPGLCRDRIGQADISYNVERPDLQKRIVS